MLHIVRHSPFERNSLSSCLRLALPGSSILLIEDAVIAATVANPLITDSLERYHYYVLVPDLKARGLIDKLQHGITAIDYPGFVELTELHPVIQSW